MIMEYKECGLTMKQFLDKIHKKYEGERFTFAARLDPMACGIVPLVPREDFKNFNSYLKSNKRYNVKVMIGIQTDSDDVLGKIEKIDSKYFDKVEINRLKVYLEGERTGEIEQKYHYFSSKRIQKRRKGDMKEYSHKVSLYKSKVVSVGYIKIRDWLVDVMRDIDKVDKSCDFRQLEILEQWKKIEILYGDKMISYMNMEMDVSSGFFVRQYVRDKIDESKVPMLAYYIKRTKIY